MYFVAARPCDHIRDTGKFVCRTGGSLQCVLIAAAVDIRVQSPGGAGMASVRLGRCGDLLSILKQANRIPLAEAERKALCAAVILIDYQKSVCRNGRSFRNGVGILVLIVLQHKAGDIQIFSSGICQLHPIRAAVGVVGLHFVDDHGADNFVLFALCSSGKVLKLAVPSGMRA